MHDKYTKAVRTAFKAAPGESMDDEARRLDQMEIAIRIAKRADAAHRDYTAGLLDARASLSAKTPTIALVESSIGSVRVATIKLYTIVDCLYDAMSICGRHKAYAAALEA